MAHNFTYPDFSLIRHGFPTTLANGVRVHCTTDQPEDHNLTCKHKIFGGKGYLEQIKLTMGRIVFSSEVEVAPATGCESCTLCNFNYSTMHIVKGVYTPSEKRACNSRSDSTTIEIFLCY